MLQGQSRDYVSAADAGARRFDSYVEALMHDGTDLIEIAGLTERITATYTERGEAARSQKTHRSSMRQGVTAFIILQPRELTPSSAF